MSGIQDNINRSILVLGPPHSGKSVFSYLLFKLLRSQDDDTNLMDADYYSPTIDRRRMDRFYHQEERDFITITPNSKKLTELTEANFRRVAHGIHEMIENEGFIIIDGLGRHTLSTESLLEISNNLIIICSNNYCVEEISTECNYLKEGTPLHPFEFYKSCKNNCIKIITYYDDKEVAFFKEDELYGELFNLNRNAISEGNIDRISIQTIATIREIAKYIINNWRI